MVSGFSRTLRAIGAMCDGSEIVGGSDHPFSKQKSRRELPVGPGRAHDDGERAIVQANLERLFGGRSIDIGGASAASDTHDLDRSLRVAHRATLPSA